MVPTGPVTWAPLGSQLSLPASRELPALSPAAAAGSLAGRGCAQLLYGWTDDGFAPRLPSCPARSSGPLSGGWRVLCCGALRELPQPLQQGLSCEEGSPPGCLAIFHPGTHLPNRTESCHSLSWDSGPAKALGRKLGRKHEAGPAPGAVGQGHKQGRGQGQGHQVGYRPPVHTLSQRPRMAMRPQGPCHH